MTDQRPEPRIPARTRLLRPALFEDEQSGRLSPAAFKAYLGISTRSDDAGYLPWRPARIAAGIWPYQPAGRRERELLRLAADLVAAGLLRLFDCGCAFLPRLVEDLAVKGGDKTTAIETYHAACAVVLQSAPDADVGLRSATEQSVSYSVSVNESVPYPSSESVPGSELASLSEPGSSGARGPRNGKTRSVIRGLQASGGEPSLKERTNGSAAFWPDGGASEPTTFDEAEANLKRISLALSQNDARVRKARTKSSELFAELPA